MGSARRCLLASCLCCHAAFISTFKPGPAHQPCFPCGRLERGASSAAVESIPDADAIGDWRLSCNHRVSNLASKVRVSHQPPEVGRLRSFFGSFPLPSVWCGSAWDADFRVYTIVIRFWCLYRGPADMNAADQSTVHLLCQDKVQTCLSLAAALWDV